MKSELRFSHVEKNVIKIKNILLRFSQLITPKKKSAHNFKLLQISSKEAKDLAATISSSLWWLSHIHGINDPTGDELFLRFKLGNDFCFAKFAIWLIDGCDVTRTFR